MKRNDPVLIYRVVVFALAAGYSIYEFITADHSAFGWQFRYLTIWALTLNTVVAWLMLRLSLGWSQKTYNTLCSTAVVLNGFVLFMYWKLYLIDPSLVNGKDGPGPWYLEYYLHGLGPVLQMIDAFFFIGGAFARSRSILASLALVVVGYIVWIEALVGPLNDSPVGSATRGLPYPFLNDMDQTERMGFYGTVIVTMLFLFAGGWIVARVIDRVLPGLARDADADA